MQYIEFYTGDNMLKSKIGFFMLCHPYEEGRKEAPQIFQRALLKLKKLNLDVVANEEAGKIWEKIKKKLVKLMWMVKKD